MWQIFNPKKIADSLSKSWVQHLPNGDVTYACPPHSVPYLLLEYLSTLEASSLTLICHATLIDRILCSTCLRGEDRNFDPQQTWRLTYFSG